MEELGKVFTKLWLSLVFHFSCDASGFDVSTCWILWNECGWWLWQDMRDPHDCEMSMMTDWACISINYCMRFLLLFSLQLYWIFLEKLKLHLWWAADCILHIFVGHFVICVCGLTYIFQREYTKHCWKSLNFWLQLIDVSMFNLLFWLKLFPRKLFWVAGMS